VPTTAPRASHIAAVLLLLAGITACDGKPVRPELGSSALEDRYTLTVEPRSLRFGAVGQERALSVVVRDQNGQTVPGPALQFRSGDTTVVRVDGGGRATAVGDGRTSLSVSMGTITASVPVQVTPGADRIEVAPESVLLDFIGATAALSAAAVGPLGDTVDTALRWSSTDTSVVRVDQSGVVTGVRPGAATIEVRADTLAPGRVEVAVQPVPAALAVAPGSVAFSAVGDTARVAATPLDAGGTPVDGAPVEYAVLDSTIAEVTPGGLVTAVAAGVTDLVVGSGAVADTVPVLVEQAVSELQLSPSALLFQALAQSADLTAAVTDRNGVAVAGAPVVFESGDTTVARVDSAGRVVALAPGTTWISGRSGPTADTASVEVRQVVTSLVPTPASLDLGALGETVTLSVAAADANGFEVDDATCTWSSDAPSVVTVSQAGLATAVSSGAATITVSCDGARATVPVSVAQLPSLVTLTPPATTLTSVDDSVALSASVLDALGSPIPAPSVSWSSSDPAVAAVSADGVATARGPGTAVVTATAGTASATAALIVSPEPASVLLSPAVDTLEALGAVLALSAQVLDASGTPVADAQVTWTSSAPAVATVDAGGIVTAVSPGGVTVTATSGTASGDAEITVAPVVSQVLVSPATATLTALGATRSFTAVPADANGNPVAGASVTWSTDDAGIASVDGSGNGLAIANGTTRIVATSGTVAGSALVTVEQVADAVTLVPGTLVLAAVGATSPLTATAADANGNPLAGPAFSWSSDDPSVVTVSQAGLVTAVAPGSTLVRASAGGASDFTNVSVVPQVSQVVATPDSLRFTALGDSAGASAQGFDANGNPVPGAPILWSSTSPGVASVDADGMVTAVGPGAAGIVARTGLGADTIPVTVTQTVTSLSVAPTALAFDALGTVQPLSATARDANGNPVPGAPVTWSSVNPAVAAVNASGVVTSVADGSTAVVARTGALEDTASVTVSQVATNLTITPGAGSLSALGATATFTGTARDAGGTPVAGVPVSWSSSDPGIFTVDASGTVTAVANGSATLTASAPGGLSATAPVTVAQAVASVSIAPGADTLRTVNGSVTLSGTARDALGNVIPGAPFTWSTSNSNVAEVSVGGVVTPDREGSATITGASGGRTATSAITVAFAVDSVVVTPDTVAFTALGALSALSATVYDTDGTPIPAPNVSWSSSDPGVATVDAIGLVTAEGSGTATIVAESGGRADTTVVTVSQPVGSISLTTSSLTFSALGYDQSVTAVARDAGGNVIPDAVFTWVSADPGVATADSTGAIRSVANGATTVTVSSGGVSRVISVSVNQVATTIQLTPSSVALSGAGSTRTVVAQAFDFVGNPIAGATFTWSSANPGVATVDQGGTITAVGNGTSAVTVTTGSRSATFLVTVSGV
jgi:uncharacterized protein YjdB